MDKLLSLLSSETGFSAGNAILALMVISTSFLMAKCMLKYNTLGLINNTLVKSERRRLKREEELRKLEGAQEKDNIFYRLDLMINQSGIRRKIRFFGTEHLVIFSLISAVVVLLMAMAAGRFYLGLAASAAVFIIPFAVISIIAGRNYRRTEGQIVHFLNLIENYTKTEDNIITIMGKVYPYMGEPLHTALKECYAEAKNTGDMPIAFRGLETKIGHDKFGEILRNLELCSKYEANYQKVVATSRDIMINYIKSSKKVRNITMDAVADLVIMFAAMLVLYKVVDSFVPGSLMALILSGKLGIAIIIYIAAVLIFSLTKIISIVRK